MGTTEMLYDYVNLDTGAGMGSVPGQPVKDLPLTGKEKDEVGGRL